MEPKQEETIKTLLAVPSNHEVAVIKQILKTNGITLDFIHITSEYELSLYLKRPIHKLLIVDVASSAFRDTTILKEANKSNPDLKIIAISDDASARRIRTVLRDSVRGFVSKSNMDRLADVIRRELGLSPAVLKGPAPPKDSPEIATKPAAIKTEQKAEPKAEPKTEKAATTKTPKKKGRVLLVDDEPHVLSGYARGLRGLFDIDTASSGQEALEKLRNGPPVAVIISDMRMPGMDGVELLKQVKRMYPETVRMMLTGNADQETAINAVNQGSIFRFLNKPCPSQNLTSAIAAALRQNRLETAERELLDMTLKGSIELLTELLSLADPDAFGNAQRMREYVKAASTALSIPQHSWELEMAAMLAPIGLLVLPPEVRLKSVQLKPLTANEIDALQKTPQSAADLISKIPRLDKVANIIASGVGRIAGDDKLADLSAAKGYDIAIGVFRFLTCVAEYENMGVTTSQAFTMASKFPGMLEATQIEKIRNQIVTLEMHIPGTELDGSPPQPEPVIDKNDKADKSPDPRSEIEPSPQQPEVLVLKLKELSIGDVLMQDVLGPDGRLLLAKRSKISKAFLARLSHHNALVGVAEPIKVRRPIKTVNF